MNLNDEDINFKLSKSEEVLKKANDELKNLQDLKRKRENPNILKEENIDLEITHQLCNEDIKIYNENILRLKEEVKINEEIILKIKKENEKLKKEKKLTNINKKDSKAYKNLILNLKDLCKNLGFKLKKKDTNEPKENMNNMNNVKDNKEEKKMENLDKIKKKKEEFSNNLKELNNKCNQCKNFIGEQNDKINEYRNYLNEVYLYMNNFREKINISVINSVMNNDDNNRKIDELNEQFEISSIILFDLDDIIFKTKNIFGQNIENLLTDIKINIDNLDKKENQTENNFKEICNIINQKNDEIKKIFSEFEKNKDNFKNVNRNVEKEIKKLKNLHEKLLNKHRHPNELNNNSNNNNNINANQNINNNQDINNSRRKRIIEQSFLFNVKNLDSKLDIYKTANLFKPKEEDSLDRFIEDSNLLRKNYHEICYIYDDYDICDIYYDLKAVGLSGGAFFSKGYHSFYSDQKIEIQSFLIDNVPSQYKLTSHWIEFNINLSNMESKKIHIKYKATKDLSRLNQGKIEERKIYRYEYYGSDGNLAGQMAKYSLILKGSFDIVNFDNYCLIRNINNKNDIEYMWGGCVPNGGKRILIMFSKKEATWSFKNSTKFTSYNFIKDTKFYIPIELIGGNNEIMNINPHSPQSTNITIDEENRQYIAEYFNTRYKEAEFIIEGEFKNKCKGEWEVDLTNEEVEKRMPREDVLCKEQLKTIAKRIIDEFDNNHRNDDFEYLDYMKIGLWVYKNIKYDYNYSGRTEYTAIDIYNMRRGVCHHFTRLSNALLYSLGYKVIYISGYCSKDNKEFDNNSRHAWSIIKLENNKWYPFDSTWGIVTGKLPVGHVFGTFTSSNSRAIGTDNLTFQNSDDLKGTFIK